MPSLKNLIEQYGFGIWADNDFSFDHGSNPFKILKESNSDMYLVEYKNGKQLQVLKECNSTNDYHILNNE